MTCWAWMTNTVNGYISTSLSSDCFGFYLRGFLQFLVSAMWAMCLYTNGLLQHYKQGVSLVQFAQVCMLSTPVEVSLQVYCCSRCFILFFHSLSLPSLSHISLCSCQEGYPCVHHCLSFRGSLVPLSSKE